MEKGKKASNLSVTNTKEDAEEKSHGITHKIVEGGKCIRFQLLRDEYYKFIKPTNDGYKANLEQILFHQLMFFLISFHDQQRHKIH